MSWYNIKLNNGKELKLNPIKIKRTGDSNLIIGKIKIKENYYNISVDCKKITHVDGFELHAIYLVRPLSTKLNDFTDQSLRIILDNKDFIISMGVIKPQ
jgi:hypothetical protein